MFVTDPQLEEKLSSAEQQGDLMYQLSATIFDGLDMTGHKNAVATALKSSVWSILDDMPFTISECKNKVQGSIANEVGISSKIKVKFSVIIFSRNLSK